MDFYNEFSLWNHSVETILSDIVKNQNFYKALSSLVHQARPLFHGRKGGLAKVRFNQSLSGQSDSAFEIHASNLCVGVQYQSAKAGTRLGLLCF